MKLPRHILAAIAVSGLVFTTGCAMREFVFSMFEDGYTEGGTTASERRWHFDRSFDRHEGVVGHYDPVNER